MGGMAARRKGPGAGLKLSQMGLSASRGESGGEGAAGGKAGVAMRLPPGAMEDGTGAAKKLASLAQGGRPGGAGGAGDSIGGTPFSNFRKIVCVRLPKHLSSGSTGRNYAARAEVGTLCSTASYSRS